MLETLRTQVLWLGVVTSKRRRSGLRDLEVFSLGRHIETLVGLLYELQHVNRHGPTTGNTQVPRKRTGT